MNKNDTLEKEIQYLGLAEKLDKRNTLSAVLRNTSKNNGQLLIATPSGTQCSVSGREQVDLVLFLEKMLSKLEADIKAEANKL
jgi:hypothetical protein